MPGAATRVFALLGDPVGHSLSPAFQNAALQHLGLDGIYVALRCAAEDAPALVRGLARAGGGGNVTVPHKAVVLDALERRTAAVERTGACNTFWLEDGRVCGDNTDVAALRASLPVDPAAATVLVLGAGGAARAAVDALLAARADRVLVHNRTRRRAEALVERFADPRLRVAHAPDEGPVDLVINATSLGLHEEDPPPVDLGRLCAGAVFDAVYRPGGTSFIREARRRGLPAADGLDMLVRQGAAAFERWWRREAPIDAMRRAVQERTT